MYVNTKNLSTGIRYTDFTWFHTPRSFNILNQIKKSISTVHGKTDWFQIGEGVRQGSILSPWLFKLCAEYIMWNARRNEAHTGIKIAGRNINILRYADYTALMAEYEEELKSLLMKVKESEKLA